MKKTTAERNIPIRCRIILFGRGTPVYFEVGIVLFLYSDLFHLLNELLVNLLATSPCIMMNRNFTHVSYISMIIF